MSTEVSAKKPMELTKEFFQKDAVKRKFEEMMGKRSTSFLTSVMQIVNSNNLLKNADPASIYNAAILAATLDLPLNNNLGFAYIIPFGQKQPDGSYQQVAQFQLGYKGYIQLAQRSGQFLTISAAPIYEGQLIEENPLTGFVIDFKKKTSDKIIGYASYFKLLNGFEKILYMSVEDLKKHGTKFSQTYKKGYGLWKDDFESMAQKTVIKLLLAKYAPLSVEMQKAVTVDSSVINNEDATDYTYVDHVDVDVVEEPSKEQLEFARVKGFIDAAESTAILATYKKNCTTDALKTIYAEKLDQLTAEGK